MRFPFDRLFSPPCTCWLVGLLALSLPLAARPRKAPPKVAPLPPAKPIPPGPARWLLTGGMMSGGHVSAQQRAQWPLWMQALCANRPGVSTQALAESDLDKVPDLFLAPAVDRLRQAGVFTPNLLAQVTEIGYTAEAALWARARTAYQKAYLAQHPLPIQDGQTCSRLLSQLVMEGESAFARSVLYSANFPDRPELRASFLRRLELRDSKSAPDPTMIRDVRIPGEERFLIWKQAALDQRERVALLPALTDTSAFGEAVLYALRKNWLSLSDPLVDRAIAHPAPAKSQSPWFLVNLGERASDLLWMRTVEALQTGRRKTAESLAEQLQNRFPDSWYAWHAAYLRGQGTPSRLRIPGDITFCNADYWAPRMARKAAPWPETWRGLADQGRYDLILARVQPRAEPQVYLRAAHMIGQQDLIVRHFAIHQDCAPDTLAFLYPTSPADYLATLIREEGCEHIVDPAFLLAAIKNESQFQPSATSSANAMGLVQLLRSTFRSVVGRKASIRDPETNIRAALRYYKRIAQVAHLAEAPEEVRYLYLVAGYHAGEGRAKRWYGESRARFGQQTDPAHMLLRTEAIPFASTRQYVWRVLGDRRMFQQALR